MNVDDKCRAKASAADAIECAENGLDPAVAWGLLTADLALVLSLLALVAILGQGRLAPGILRLTLTAGFSVAIFGLFLTIYTDPVSEETKQLAAFLIGAVLAGLNILSFVAVLNKRRPVAPVTINATVVRPQSSAATAVATAAGASAVLLAAFAGVVAAGRAVARRHRVP